MKLDSIRFTEFGGKPQEWVLDQIHLDAVNLIVGKNASGKSRLLTIISSLAKLLSAPLQVMFQSGEYHACFSIGNHTYEYDLNYEDKLVIKEVFSKDGRILLKRGPDGAGTIWAERIGQDIEFETPKEQIAARIKRDAIQHPFFEDLHTWATRLRHYEFGTPFGRDRVFLIPMQTPTLDEVNRPEVTDPNEVTKLYSRAFEEFGPEFDRHILRDLESLGYRCNDVGAELADPKVIQGPPIAVLFVKEVELETKTTQFVMSQGMFRALSLVIHLNYCVFRKEPRTILIDDIGEGLDFSRAHSFIALLISRAVENNLQLIMTTNDRFVMNGVPLQYWGVISRSKGRVQVINKRNSPKIFEEFEELGLNNFDFFSSNFFEEGRQ